MIIIDTNVWVSFFKGEKKAILLKDMIIENQAVVHPYVYGELLLGGISRGTGQLLLSLASVPVTGEELIYYFIMENKIHSKGIGWVDVNILVSALTEKHRVLTFDKNFEAICREFGCFFN